MAERAPWWRAFLGKRKSITKETATASATQEDQERDPFTPQASSASPPKTGPGEPATQSHTTTTPPPAELSGSSLFTDETYDDSQLEPVFNEQTCRRHMRVSRSGRFKEKRRVRSSLPLEEKEKEAEQGKEDVR